MNYYLFSTGKCNRFQERVTLISTGLSGLSSNTKRFNHMEILESIYDALAREYNTVAKMPLFNAHNVRVVTEWYSMSV